MRETWIKAICEQIKPLNEKAMERAKQHLDRLTKPPGSLGRMEELAVQLAGITGDIAGELDDKRIVIMAADHGVTEEGVSAFPREVTVQMVANFINGGAAINVMARQAGASLVCVDVGVDGDLSKSDGLFHRKVARGTRNMVQEAAMSEGELKAAIEVGLELAAQQAEAGAQLIATGEMGIGNTTASSAVLAALTAASAEDVVGSGTGVTSERLRHKQQVVRQALQRHRPDPDNPLDVMQKVGGLEIAALAGLILGCAVHRIPVVIDGFISTVAALSAVRLCPEVRDYLIPSHLSEEKGHRIALEAISLKPMLHMGMRLGEGTGAALMFPVIDTARRIMREMATFEEAQVARQKGE
ncbi:MAG: nicotinate-nucleotide--dimethylbenzimidazole phosphoribosyltransferase [Bacillaceae bacterium]|nr:nicotinate-nucleotide--dimethylbenzimidazole phosphoribosyltransferase [Bacillaceae bacterium]